MTTTETLIVTDSFTAEPFGDGVRVRHTYGYGCNAVYSIDSTGHVVINADPGWSALDGEVQAVRSLLAERAGDLAFKATSVLMREIREVMHLPEDNPRRVAAMDEKRRVLALIELSNARPS